jgi:hypothetical protein
MLMLTVYCIDVKLRLSHSGRTQFENVWEQSAEENIWTYEGQSDGKLKKCMSISVMCSLLHKLLGWPKH